MDPRLTILRMIHGCLAVLLLLWLCPEMSWVPLALFMPPLFATSPCTLCSGGTQGVTNIQVDFAGIANNGCTDCNNLNTTYILGFVADCAYSLSTGKTLCGTPATIVSVAFWWDRPGAQNTVCEINDGGGAGAEARWETSLPSPHNCQDGTGVFGSANPTDPGTSLRCDYSSATCTVTPTP
jgi:hypothetical protein